MTNPSAEDQPMAAASGGDHSDGSSDSDSSDNDAFELSEQDMAAMQSLEEALKANPYGYQNHVQYITLLRKAKLRERLKAARRTMQEVFPLTEQLWVEWLDDEAPSTSCAGMMKLFELAVGEYLSIAIWRKYLEYVQDHLAEVAAGDAAAQDSLRQLCERALTAGGLHVTQGSQLWNTAREWEASLLAQNSADEKQQARVRSLFHRQLQVPLADGAAALAAYQAWETSLQPGFDVPQNMAQAHEKAQAAAALRAASEASVAPGKPADHDLLAAFRAYIMLEKRAGDPARVQVVFERAVAQFAVTHGLWLDYARYLEAELKSAALVVPVYARAARNCPWVGLVWGRYLNALERAGAEEQEQAAVYGRALSAGLQTSEDYMEVILARLDAIRRRGAEAMPQLRDAFAAASQTLQAAFGDVPDPSLRLTAYWADCEAHLAGDVTAARAVWEAALKTAAGRASEAWAAYIAMERSLRNIREARTLYKRCYARKFADGSQPALCHAWLRFEREEGSADDYLQACLKAEPILAEAASAAAVAADAETAALAKAAVEKAPMLSKDEMQQLRQQRDPNFRKAAAAKAADGKQPAGRKRRQQDEPQHAQGKKLRTDAAEVVTAAAAAAPDAAAADQPAPMDADQPTASADAAAASAAPGESTAAGAGPASPRTSGAALPDASQQTTAFVRNIHRDTTDEELRDFCTACGAVKAVRHIRHHLGTSKGFAYVEFEDRQGLDAAIAQSGTELRGQPLNIAQSRPPRGDRGGRGHGGRGGGRFGERSRGGGISSRGGGPGGRGVHGRGRGRHEPDGPIGLGGGAGRAGWGGSAAGKQHQKMDLQSGASKPGLGFFKPRAVAVSNAEEHHPARTNDEFRKMILAKKQGPAGDNAGQSARASDSKQ